ncbi:MAG: gamma carbonic anhydrase family protein [Thermoplasmata archaeon]
MTVRGVGGKEPVLGDGVYVDPTAVVIGDVRLRDGVSIWPGAVVRADDDFVEVGRGSAIMDVAFVEAPKGRPVTIGQGTIISHGARLHGCSVSEECLVGIGAIILDGATIGARSVVAAGTLISPGAKIPPESFVIGVPGKVARTTSVAELDRARHDLRLIAAKAKLYASTL